MHTDAIGFKIDKGMQIKIIPPQKVSSAYNLRKKIPEFFLPDYPFIPQKLFDPYLRTQGILLGAYYQNKLVAYSSVFKFEPPQDKPTLIKLQNMIAPSSMLWVNESAVLPRYRGLGIMRKFNQYLIHHAKSKSYRYLGCRTWNLRTDALIAKTKFGWYIVNLEPREDLEHLRIDLVFDLKNKPASVSPSLIHKYKSSLAPLKPKSISAKNSQLEKRIAIHSSGFLLKKIIARPRFEDYCLHFSSNSGI